MSVSSEPAPRLVSLDQFRGYTVAGMFLVNYLAGFAITPAVLKHHHSYCSYADTIMPQFLFAVGFAFRLTFARRTGTQGLRSAYLRAARRIGSLAILSVVLYTLGAFGPTWARIESGEVGSAIAELAKRQWFQTLMHIAVTSLWVLPVIRAAAAVRVGYMVLSAAAHIALSAWFNFAWVNTPPNGIDGGPLGFLTWTIPAMVGTFACDAVSGPTGRANLKGMLGWSLSLIVAGYALSCGTRLYDVTAATEMPKLASSPVAVPLDHLADRPPASLLAEPPFIPPPDAAHRQWNYWMMSQRSGSVSYLTFAAGFSLALFVLFYLACDRFHLQIGLLRTLGVNALAGYILHGALETAVKPFIPRDAGWLPVAAGFAVCFGVTYAVLRLMEKKRIFLRM